MEDEAAPPPPLSHSFISKGKGLTFAAATYSVVFWAPHQDRSGFESHIQKMPEKDKDPIWLKKTKNVSVPLSDNS